VHHGRLLIALVALAFAACKDNPPGGSTKKAPTPFPRVNGYEVALTLAALRDANTGKLTDKELVERHRMKIESGLGLYRRYALDINPGPSTIMKDEIRHVLHIEPKSSLARGDTVELVVELLHVTQVIAAILDPAARIFERTQALTGADANAVRQQLVEHLAVDLTARTIRNKPWSNPPGESTAWGPRVVDKVKEPGLEIAVADATRLDPNAKVGQMLTLTSLVTRPAEAPRLHKPPALELNVDADDFERLRGLVTPIGTFETPHGKVPLRRFYVEQYGVQYIEVPRENAMALWKHLDADAAKSGLRPYVFSGDSEWLRNARIAWQSSEPRMMQAAMHPDKSPMAVLGALAAVDVKALLKAGGNPSYPDHRPKHGPPPPPPKGSAELAATAPAPDGVNEPNRVILLVLVDAAWKGPAFLRGFVDSGEATPSLAQAVVVSRHWEETYGARLAAMGPAKLEWALTRKLSKKEALALAEELLVFAPDSYGDATIEDVAAQLAVDVSFTAWWD
jgi:hypothetical protein